jgi:AraC-like DNA-binding protein
VSTAAAELRVSTSQLGRDFARVVGMSPRVLARLLRVRRLLESIDVTASMDWGARAAELGWYDQAHLIRDFRRHTGVTPTAYLEAQGIFEQSGEDTTVGFVPEARGNRTRDRSKT